MICIISITAIQAQTNSIPKVIDTNSLKPIVLKTGLDSVLKMADSTKPIKPKWYKNWQPVGIYIGADIPKTILSITNKNNVRIESIIDIYLKNTNWLGINIGYTNASFATNALQYSSSSTGALFTLQKSLFPFTYSTDRDNAFIGIGYGIALNRVGQANYIIKDIWGSTNGITVANNNTAHFVELNAGFRVAITKRIMMGWRMQGKTIMNNKIFTDIAPITIANYGSGDKSAVFGYNLAITYRLF